MDELGKVTEIRGGDATVKFKRKPACEKCGMCFGGKDTMEMSLTLKNDVSAKVGDTVRVSTNSGSVLKSALIVYLIPLLFFFIGLVAVKEIWGDDLASFIAAFAMLAAGYGVLYLIDKKVYAKSRDKILPRIISIENGETNQI